MHPLRRLASQTAIYGLSTIVVRVLNYLLAPLHTRVFTDQSDYGVISELYAYVTFLNVLFMYGMETAFFRYASQSENKQKVFGTAQLSLVISTVVLTLLLIITSSNIAAGLKYPDHPEYVIYFALIIAFDTLVSIPFARLRLQGKPLKYALFKFLNISINVLLNLFFLLPALLNKPAMFSNVGFTYNPETGVEYVFIANLIASGVAFLIFLPSMLNLQFDKAMWRKLISYGSPLIIIGLAGMINETLDRILLKYWLPGTTDENLKQIGIYSAVYKISIFMTLAVQAFRMGAEPFFFSQANEKNAPRLYADVMKYFVIACSFIFLTVGIFPDAFKIIIGPAYHEGLHIVPILLMANLFLGIYYNQSIWYKLTDKTVFATIIPVAGAIITLTANWFLIPRIGYSGSAWSTLLCYFSMVIMSWIIGQKYYNVPYNLRKAILYISTSLVLCLIGLQLLNTNLNYVIIVVVRFLLIAMFILLAWWMDGYRLFKASRDNTVH